MRPFLICPKGPRGGVREEVLVGSAGALSICYVLV